MTRDIAIAPRVPAGVRTGGQFAVDARSEADFDLAAPASDVVDLAPEQLALQAIMAARHHVRNKGLRFTDPRDIAQSTVLTILQARKNSPNRVVTPAYVHQITSGHVAITARGILRPEDRKAIGIYEAKVREAQGSLGRILSPNERCAVAAEIRETWPDQRHKPSEGFVQLAAIRVGSLDAPAGESGTSTVAETIADTVVDEQSGEAIDPDSVAGQVLANAEGRRYTRGKDGQAQVVDGTRKRALAMDKLWEAFSEISGVPEAPAGTISTAQRKAAAAKVAAAGGVIAACKNWTDDHATPAVDALFAPFGQIGADEKDEVVELLQRHSAYADDLWGAACRAASKRRPSAD